MQKILIVEDDVIICGGLKTYLESLGYAADGVFTFSDAVHALQNRYQLVILDVNLPDGNGMELCRMIRSNSGTPVIFLTANDTEENMVEGFRNGCDDYIAKPFSVEILKQRIKAVLRRSQSDSTSEIFSYQALSVDFRKMRVSVHGVPVKLSATEYKLLELIIQNKGQVLTRNVILERVWDCHENYVDENTLNVHIRRLRQKIEEDSKNPKYIITVFGIGYTFGE